MKSKIYSSEYMKSSSKGQRWIPAFAMIAFLLAFPVAELILIVPQDLRLPLQQCYSVKDNVIKVQRASSHQFFLVEDRKSVV